MSESSAPRRIAAEIRFDEERSGIDQVGSHSIHHYWHLFAPHFRDVLMSPQRRFDDGGVAWNWRESGESRPVSVSELTAVRKKLLESNRAFAEGPDGSDEGGEGNTLTTLEQVREQMDRITTTLTAKPDAELRAFVGRTESGPMVHSWGASTPAQPYNPDAHECEISGVVIVGEERAAGYEVVLENRKGVRIARQVSEGEEGGFCFPKIGAGEYRVRVISDRVRFPLSGLSVTIERSSATGLELRSTSSPEAPPKPESAEPTFDEAAEVSADPESPVVSETEDRPPRRRIFVWIGVVLLIASVTVFFAWNKKRSSAASSETSSTDSTSITSAQTAAEKAKRASVVVPATAVSGNIGEDGVSQPRERNRSAVSAHSKGSDPASTRESSLRHPVAKGTEFDGFDLPSDSGSATKPRPVQMPPPVSAGSLDSSPGPGGGTDAGSNPESKPENGAALGPISASADQPSLPGAVQKATSSTRSKKLPPASPGPTNLAKKPEHEPTPQALAAEPDEAKSDLPNKSAASPASAVIPTVAPAPSNKETPEALATHPVPEKEKEKEKPPTESDEPSPAKPTARPKTPTPQPNLSPEKPRVTPAKTNSQNAALTPPRESPKIKPATTPPGSETPAGQAESANPTASSSLEEPAKAPTEASAATSVAAARTHSSSDSNAESTSEKKDRPRDQTRIAPSSPDGEDSATVNTADPNESTPPLTRALPRASSGALTTRLSSWTLRLTDDSILPTEPIRMGDKDTSEAVRAQQLQLRKKQLTQTLLHPLVHCGYAFEIPGGNGKSRWQADAEAPGIETTLVNDRAEISWMGALPPKTGSYRLIGAGGDELATFQIDAKGISHIQTALHVRRHFWIGIERAASDRAKVTVTEWADRFVWDRLPGSSVQIQWKRDLRWLGGKGDRIELSGEVHNGQPSLVWLTYGDRATGWVLFSELEQTSDAGGDPR